MCLQCFWNVFSLKKKKKKLEYLCFYFLQLTPLYILLKLLMLHILSSQYRSVAFGIAVNKIRWFHTRTWSGYRLQKPPLKSRLFWRGRWGALLVQRGCEGWRRPWPRHLPWHWSGRWLAGSSISDHDQKFQAATYLIPRHQVPFLPFKYEPANLTSVVKCCNFFLLWTLFFLQLHQTLWSLPVIRFESRPIWFLKLLLA